MDRLLKVYKLLKFTQEETDNLKSPIYTSKELKYVVKNLQGKFQAHMTSLENSTKYWRNNINSTQTFPENWRGGNTSPLFYDASVTLVPKDTDITINKNYESVSLLLR